MPISKNKGPLLTTKVRGGKDDFPKEFLASVGIDITEQEVPLDIDPDFIPAITGLLIESAILQDRTNERKKVNTYLTDIPGPLTSDVFNPQTGQIEERTRSLVQVDTDLIADARTTEADQHNLGNGYFDQTVTEAPSLFHRYVYGRERRIVTPEDFLALLQTHRYEHTEDGQASDPILGTGDISITDSDETVFQHRLSQEFIDPAGIPQTIHNKRTNQYKQVVDVARTLEYDTTGAILPSATQDTEWTKLGDGTALSIVSSVDEVFDERTASIEIPDLVPEVFKALFPITTDDYVEPGTTIDDPPTLLPGELFREEKRETEFTRRIRTRGRVGVTYGTVITGGYVSEIHGGAVIARSATLEPFIQFPDTGFDIVKSEVTNLGNGTWVKDNEALFAEFVWPTLLDDEFDPVKQIRVQTERQVVELPYTPATPVPGTDFFVEDVVSIDRWRGNRKKITKDVSAFRDKDSAQISYRYHPFQFPGTFDYNRNITFGHREGYRRATAMLAKHTVRKWWINRATPPTVGNQELGSFDVDVKEIITDTVNVPVFTTGNTTESQTYPEVLHDDITNTLGAFYPATTPSFTEYYLGISSGVSGTYYIAFVAAQGTGYTLGTSCTVGAGSFTVAIVGSSGELIALRPSAPTNVIVTGVTDLGNFAVSGGGGTGANAELYQVDFDYTVPGSGWVGNERCIAAEIKPTEIPNLWEVTTESAVMR